VTVIERALETDVAEPIRTLAHEKLQDSETASLQLESRRDLETARRAHLVGNGLGRSASEDSFRIRSYRQRRHGCGREPLRRSRIFVRHPERKVTEIPGIGKGWLMCGRKLSLTGSCDGATALLEKFPPTALEFLKIRAWDRRALP